MADSDARPVLVGEQNPLSLDPGDALWPDPPGCAGHRLAIILGLPPDEYLRSFTRLNLLAASRWSAPDAREAARRISYRHCPAPLILLGRRVAAAFGYADLPAFSHTIRASPRGAEPGVSHVALLPHPSGRCRAWNAPGAPERGRLLVAQVVESAYPDVAARLRR